MLIEILQETNLDRAKAHVVGATLARGRRTEKIEGRTPRRVRTAVKIEENWLKKRAQLQSQLSLGWRNGGQLTPLTVKKASGADRLLLVPGVYDLIAHRAVLQIIVKRIHPLLVPKICMLAHSIHQPGEQRFAVASEIAARRLKTPQYGECLDFSDFFPSVPVADVLDQLQREFGDDLVIEIIGSMLRAEISQTEDESSLQLIAALGTDGLPQGCALSPLLSSFYVRAQDLWLADQPVFARRYIDDVIIMTDSQSVLVDVVGNYVQQLPSGLELKEGKHKPFTPRQACQFLGLRILPGGAIKPGLKASGQLCDNLKDHVRRTWKNPRYDCLEAAQNTAVGWSEAMSMCHWTTGEIEDLCSSTRARVGAICRGHARTARLAEDICVAVATSLRDRLDRVRH